MNKFNFFDNITTNKESEIFEEILKNDRVRVERIVSNGQNSEENFWYDQDEVEMILLLQGEATLEFEDFDIVLKKGDFFQINSHQKHRVKSTSKIEPTIWLAIFYK